MFTLEFEKPIIELRLKIEELKQLSVQEDVDTAKEVEALTKKLGTKSMEVYGNLSTWQKTQVARHPNRLSTTEFIEFACSDFIELKGDRCFRDDPAIVGGFATLAGEKIMIIGHQKGHNTAENVARNFGMPYPEGYRKALRLMQLAEKFGLPVLTLIDTPGAYPGIEAEERGQSAAIAVNLKEMADLCVPIVTVICGEGGSGGALALGVANAVLMLEHAIYSVISPEGCAGILWGDGSRAPDAAQALRYTAKYLKDFGLIDDIVSEPVGGAHRSPEQTSQQITDKVIEQLKPLLPMSAEEIVEQRYNKFRCMGAFRDNAAFGE